MIVKQRRLAPIKHARVRTRAYKLAKEMQAMSRSENAAFFENHRVELAVSDDDPRHVVTVHAFRDYCAAGGNPYDLLAASHDGKTLDQVLSLPWPPPRYVRKRKSWLADEPRHLCELRAEVWVRDALRVKLLAGGPDVQAEVREAKSTAYRTAKDYVRTTSKYPNRIATEVHARGITFDQWVAETFAPFIDVGGEPRELMHAVGNGLTLKAYLVAPTAAVPYMKPQSPRKAPAK